MPSSYSPNLRLELQATGENRSTWGTKANNVFSLVEQAITGYVSIAMVDANVTLTAVNGATDQSRNAIVNLTGAHTAIRTVTIPSVPKVYVFKNSTTGGFAVNIKTAAGSTYVLPTGATRIVYCDGTNTFSSTVALSVAEGGTGGTTQSEARTGLGLGTAATQNTGTSGATVPLLNGTNTWTGEQTFQGTQNRFRNSGNTSGVDIETGGSIEITSTTNSALIDFKNAVGNDYDVRIIQTGANGLTITTTGGDITLQGGNVSAYNGGTLIGQFNSGGLAMASNMEIAFSGTGAQETKDNLGVKKYESSAQTITLGGLVSVAHGLGATPTIVQLWAECAVANNGFSVGELVKLGGAADHSGGTAPMGCSMSYNSTTIYIRTADSRFAAAIINMDTGAWDDPVASNWRYRIKAILV